MKFDIEVPTCREGVFVPVPFAGPKEIIHVIQRAEKLGFNTVWATDFLTPVPNYAVPDKDPPNWYEPLITLAYAAAATKRVRLGAGVIMLPYREPVVLAKQIATLDQFSGGRLDLGVGLGIFREEFKALRPHLAKAPRGKVMDETLEAIRMLLGANRQEVTYQGKYVQFFGVNLHPKPVQDPLPIYIPGQAEESLERTARWGTGFMAPAARIVERVEALKPVMEKYERDVFSLDIIGEAELCLAETHEKAVEKYKNSRQGKFRTRRIPLENVVAGHWIGTPQEVIEKIGKVAEQGISHFNALHVAGDTVEEMQEQMELFAQAVMKPLYN